MTAKGMNGAVHHLRCHVEDLNALALLVYGSYDRIEKKDLSGVIDFVARYLEMASTAADEHVDTFDEAARKIEKQDGAR